MQVAVTPSLQNVTNACQRRFLPVERQCYLEEEITLRHFPPIFGYRQDSL